jgi:hypothetical protein
MDSYGLCAFDVPSALFALECGRPFGMERFDSLTEIV